MLLELSIPLFAAATEASRLVLLVEQHERTVVAVRCRRRSERRDRRVDGRGRLGQILLRVAIAARLLATVTGRDADRAVGFGRLAEVVSQVGHLVEVAQLRAYPVLLVLDAPHAHNFDAAASTRVLALLLIVEKRMERVEQIAVSLQRPVVYQNVLTNMCLIIDV